MIILKRDMTLGLSIAFSWAWASSLVIGQTIAQERGIAPFMIWAVANTLTLALFGWLFHKGLFVDRIFKSKTFKVFAIIIQAFCLIINLNILNSILGNYWATTGIGLAFITLMYRRGLRTSIITDKWQGAITFVTLIAIVVFGLFSGADIQRHFMTSEGGVMWALWSACILLSSPFGDIQMWQRARVSHSVRPFVYASCLFAAYMSLIFIMSFFVFSPVMRAMLLVACLAVTTSTIDSIAVAMHEVSSKRAGTALAAFLCLFWGVFKQIGVVELWSAIGVYRVAFCVGVLAWAIWLQRGKFKREDTENQA